VKPISVIYKIFLTLVVGLLSTTMYKFSPTSPTTPMPTPNAPIESPTIAPTLNVPYQTRNELLVLEITLKEDATPEIKSISELKEGRLTPDENGQAIIQLVDDSGSILYQVSLSSVFFYGEPPKKHPEINKIVILPNDSKAAKVRVVYQEWKVESALHGN
jgi:hypothetical protein